MVEALIGLLILVIVLGIIYYLVSLLIDMIPMDGNFKQIAKVLLLLVFVLVLLMRVLPLLGVGWGHV